jgi:hypothetical protein
MLYQGYVTLDDEAYDGTGYFKFAIVNAAGNFTYWSNDNTSSSGSEPSASISLQVDKGYFTIALGDTSRSGMSQTLSPSVFLGSGRHLRVWFAQTASGSFTPLSLVPITTAPYALNAETLDGRDSSSFASAYHDHWGEFWSGSATGLALNSTDGYGVLGSSDDLDGVRGISTGEGLADNGVYGETNSTYSGEAGVYGYSAGESSGVIGRNPGSSGPGVMGLAADGAEEDAHPNGIYWHGGGEFVGPNGVIGSSYPSLGGGYGVLGLAQGPYGRGVFGRSTPTNSVTYGGYFISESISGTGVLAEGSAADIVLGTNEAGTIRSSPNVDHSDIYLYSNDEIEIHIDTDGNSTSSFRIYDEFYNTLFRVDENGNMTASGTKSSVVHTQDENTRKMYAIESPEVWFEDFGTAQLTNGESQIEIDPLFAETVNLTTTYHVYLTPISNEAVLLFITGKAPTSFTVRGVDLDGQQANAEFDYRVVAKRVGYESVRMEITPTTLSEEPMMITGESDIPTPSLQEQKVVTITQEQEE